MARRNVEVFSLSFLDVICCGFGAVILFYTIISAQSGIERARKAEDLSAQVSKLEEQVITGAKNLVILRNTLKKSESETAFASSRATQLIEELQRKREESFIYDAETLAKRERIEKLKADVKALEESSRRLEASAKVATPRSELIGTGKSRASRRYITGLTLKGRRILVLFDRSASMLDEDLVNIIRLRNSLPAVQQGAEKWRRATDIASWIVNEISDDAQFQVYAFNTSAAALLEGSAGEWIRGDDQVRRAKLLDAIAQLAPAGGTSLLNAFVAIRDMKVPPDQVILITDGLPTQGATAPALRRFVDAADRAKLFDEAIRGLNKNVPVDVVLLPMKGDVPAPHRFWGLARLTKGAFVMPSPDWP
ncbi:MAG: VWA domain-containing protein [Gammaproteobacteria bacterium]|nr:VWA domain-containing protein [Gammaproteobacteria bacterium]